MITSVRVTYFKLFEDQTFDLSEHVVLAGPNNSGKTTLLQAIAVWNMALQKWKAERGHQTRSKAKQRTGVAITRKEFTAIPLRDMNLLWTDTLTALRKEERKSGQKPGHPRIMSIAVSGKDGGTAWELSLEFRYQSRELIYVRPLADQVERLPAAAEEMTVVHVSPFSGIGAEETRYDRPYQDLLIGQGKPGDILRNLLLEVHQPEDKTAWKNLSDEIEAMFGYRLIPPTYYALPFILAEYLPGAPRGRSKDGLHPLDISCAGSGFHQVLLLMAFLHARKATVLLLDEPDAHLHVILQKQVYDRLRRIAAERGGQLIIATHSEVLVDGTSPDQILSFYGPPHKLVSDVERDQVREALKRVSATDILLAEEASGVLYVEDQSDFNLLRAWAGILDHPLAAWLSGRPFWHANKGRNPAEARAHFFALRAIKPDMRGYLLLDGDNRGLPDHEVRADGLEVGRWRRYEAESYLLHPESLRRYAEQHDQELFGQAAMEYLQDQLPAAVLRDPLGEHDYLDRTPASKTLLPGFFTRSELRLRKNEYYLVAERMKPDEIAPEVKEKLDEIARALNLI